MSQREPVLDEESAERLLRKAFPGANLTALEAVGGGLVNTNYHAQFDASPCQALLRVYSYQGLRRKAEKECRILGLLRKAGVPVPEVHVLDDTREILPYDCAVLGWIPGVALSEVLAEMSTAEAEAMGREIGVALARIHAVKVERFGKFPEEEPGPATANARDYTFKQARYLLERSRERGLLDAETDRCAERYLETAISLIDPAEPPVLVHSDFHESNLLTAMEDGRWRLKGVVDFEHSRGWLGDYDFVWLYWETYPKRPEMEAAVLAGYRSILEISGQFRERVRLFEVIKALGYIPWFHERQQFDEMAWSLGKLEELVT